MLSRGLGGLPHRVWRVAKTLEIGRYARGPHGGKSSAGKFAVNGRHVHQQRGSDQGSGDVSPGRGGERRRRPARPGRPCRGDRHGRRRHRRSEDRRHRGLHERRRARLRGRARAARGRGRARARRPHGDRARLRRRDPAPARGRTLQPAPRAFADRRALQQLLVLGRARPRHRGRDAPPPRRAAARRTAGLRRRSTTSSGATEIVDRQLRAARARSWLASSGRSPPAATSPVDRVSDAVLLTDAIAAAAPGRFADGKVKLALADGDEGPRAAPRADARTAARRRSAQELDVPDIGGSLEALADEFSVEGSGDGDYLAIRFSSPAPAP